MTVGELNKGNACRSDGAASARRATTFHHLWSRKRRKWNKARQTLRGTIRGLLSFAKEFIDRNDIFSVLFSIYTARRECVRKCISLKSGNDRCPTHAVYDTSLCLLLQLYTSACFYSNSSLGFWRIQSCPPIPDNQEVIWSSTNSKIGFKVWRPLIDI